MMRVRRYPWGVLSVNDSTLSDFTALRHFIVDHISDLRERTRDVHYENYRMQRLRGCPGPIVDGATPLPSSVPLAAPSRLSDSGESAASGANSTGEYEQKRRQLQQEEARLEALKAELERQAKQLHLRQMPEHSDA